jgi:hypothetical protein
VAPVWATWDSVPFKRLAGYHSAAIIRNPRGNVLRLSLIQTRHGAASDLTRLHYDT